MTVKFYLKRANNSCESVIFARLNHNMVCYNYYLLEKIHPINWSFKKQRAKNGPQSIGALEFNKRLAYVSDKIIEAFYKYQNTHSGHASSPKFFREVLDGIFNKQK